MAVKTPITHIGNFSVAERYYDLETAYGYGGYYCSTENPDFIKKALDAYLIQCLQENIIAEFVRYHPYNNFPMLHKESFDFLMIDRQTVSIDLSLSKESRWSRYSSTTRNILRKYSPGMVFQETADIECFMHMYRKTMDKNNANSFFYFSKEYYQRLLSMPNVKLFSVEFDNQIVNMSFVLIGRDLAHYHLSASNADFVKLHGNYFMLDNVCDHLNVYFPKVSQLHLGGGRSNQESDSLLAFKAKFSQIRNSFYIAGKIFNNNVYQKYIDKFNLLHPEFNNTKYFLKYRLGSL